MSAFLALLARDLTLATRIGGGVTLAVTFFAGVVTLVPLGIGAEKALLAQVAAGMIWVAAALAALLALDRLFQADHEDGSLDQLALSGLPLEAVALAKIAAHWIATGLPIVIVAPVLALTLSLPVDALGALVLGLLCGTPAFSAFGAIGAALTLSVRRGGLLLSLLVLPLYAPVVIFGAGAVAALVNGFGAEQGILFVAALSVLSLALAPVAAAAAVRLHVA